MFSLNENCTVKCCNAYEDSSLSKSWPVGFQNLRNAADDQQHSRRSSTSKTNENVRKSVRMN